MGGVKHDAASSSPSASLLLAACLSLGGCGFIDQRLQTHIDAVRDTLGPHMSDVDEPFQGAPPLWVLSEHTPPPLSQEELSTLAEELAPDLPTEAVPPEVDSEKTP